MGSPLKSYLLLALNLASQLACVSGMLTSPLLAVPSHYVYVGYQVLTNYHRYNIPACPFSFLAHYHQQTSSVSTNLVLTVRKAMSLLFSIWWFGNGYNFQLGLGSVLVFVGGILFTLSSKPPQVGDAKVKVQ